MNLPDKTFIYKITNLLNRKVYIGQTNNLKRRWSQHISAAKKNPTLIINHAIAKYGKENFFFEVIEECDNKIEANYQEVWQIFTHCSLLSQGGYNAAEGGANPNPQVYSEARLAKMSERMRGTKFHLGMKHSEETKRRISQTKLGTKTKPPSEETRKKMSEAKLKSGALKGRTWKLIDGKRVWL